MGGSGSSSQPTSYWQNSVFCSYRSKVCFPVGCHPGSLSAPLAACSSLVTCPRLAEVLCCLVISELQLACSSPAAHLVRSGPPSGGGIAWPVTGVGLLGPPEIPAPTVPTPGPSLCPESYTSELDPEQRTQGPLPSSAPGQFPALEGLQENERSRKHWNVGEKGC